MAADGFHQVEREAILFLLKHKGFQRTYKALRRNQAQAPGAGWDGVIGGWRDRGERNGAFRIQGAITQSCFSGQPRTLPTPSSFHIPFDDFQNETFLKRLCIRKRYQQEQHKALKDRCLAVGPGPQEREKSLFCCHQYRWTGSEDHFLSRQKPREEEPGKGHVQTNISTKLKDFQNALGTHTTYRTTRKPPWNLNSQQSLQGTFLQMFPEKVPCGHGSGEAGGHYKGLLWEMETLSITHQ